MQSYEKNRDVGYFFQLKSVSRTFVVFAGCFLGDCRARIGGWGGCRRRRRERAIVLGPLWALLGHRLPWAAGLTMGALRVARREPAGQVGSKGLTGGGRF